MLSSARLRFINKISLLNEFFSAYYHISASDLFSSPGRIEIIGNHTDHNNGKVLVGTVDLSILALTSKCEENKFIYKTKGFNEMAVDLNDLELREEEYGKSISLIRGVLFFLKKRGYKIGGVKVITSTNIFKGAGVSSSAAFEVLIAKIMSFYYNDDQISSLELALVAQEAETYYFNKPCGLLDQLGISLGGINYIDFKDEKNPLIKNLDYTFKEYDIVLTHCIDSHSKMVAYYAKIKKDMYKVAKFFNKDTLREVDFSLLLENKEEIIKQIGERQYNRAEHYFKENQRVEKAYQCLLDLDEKGFINCIEASGQSSFLKLQNCYDKSIEENLPQGIILSHKILKDGATRVHGGGFAGTMIAFVNKKETNHYIELLKHRFGDKNVTRVRISKFGTRHVSTIKEILNEGGNNYESNSNS